MFQIAPECTIVSTVFQKSHGPNKSRCRFWYDLKNRPFQYNHRMTKYPFDVRFWLTVSYKRWFRVYFNSLMFTVLAVNARWATISFKYFRDVYPWPSNIERQCAKLHQKIVPFIKQVYMNESSQIPNVIDRCCSVSICLLCFRCKDKPTSWTVRCKEFINVDIICVANTVI